MFATTYSGGAIWWTLKEERQAWCSLQVKLCDPYLSALRRCVKALYKYYSFSFLSFPFLSTLSSFSLPFLPVSSLPLPLKVGPLNTARGFRERCKFPQWVLGRSPSRQTILLAWLQLCWTRWPPANTPVVTYKVGIPANGHPSQFKPGSV